jgi:TatD DNase family protein
MIDTHCHLNFPELEEQLDAVVERALAAGIDRFVVPGTDLTTSTSSVNIALKNERAFAAIGIHPTDAHEFTEDNSQKLKELIGANNKVVSIGEVGLDYYHFEGLNEQEIQERKRAQQEVFSTMISWAKQANLPLILHTRECFEDAFRIMNEQAKGHPAVIHCFTGTMEEAIQWIEFGCYISFTGVITYKKNDALREVVRAMPLERIMLETDAPYLAPEGFRGQLCEPKFVRNVAETVAEVKGLSVEEVDRITTENAERFFNLNA